MKINRLATLVILGSAFSSMLNVTSITAEAASTINKSPSVFIKDVPEKIIESDEGLLKEPHIPESMLDGFVMTRQKDFESDTVNDSFIYRVPDEIIERDAGLLKKPEIPDSMIDRFILEFRQDGQFRDESTNTRIHKQINLYQFPEYNNGGDQPIHYNTRVIDVVGVDTPIITEEISYSGLIAGQTYHIEVQYELLVTITHNDTSTSTVAVNLGSEGVVYSGLFTPERDHGIHYIHYSMSDNLIDQINSLSKEHEVLTVNSRVTLTAIDS